MQSYACVRTTFYKLSRGGGGRVLSFSSITSSNLDKLANFGLQRTKYLVVFQLTNACIRSQPSHLLIHCITYLSGTGTSLQSVVNVMFSKLAEIQIKNFIY